MKKWLILLSITVLFNSCSWQTRFCIFNYSTVPVRVIYQINSFKDSPNSFFNSKPRIYEVNKGVDELNTINFPPQDCVSDSITNTVTINLKPNEVVFVGELNAIYNPSTAEHRKIITENIKHLTLIKSSDTLRCSKAMIPELFVKTKQKHQFGIYVR